MNKYRHFFQEVLQKSPYHLYKEEKEQYDKRSTAFCLRTSTAASVITALILNFNSHEVIDVVLSVLFSAIVYGVSLGFTNLSSSFWLSSLPWLKKKTQQYKHIRQCMISYLSNVDFQHSFLIHLETMTSELLLETKRDTKAMKKVLKEHYKELKDAFIKEQYENAFYHFNAVVDLMETLNIQFMEKEKAQQFEQTHLSYKKILEVPIFQEKKEQLEKHEKEINGDMEFDWKKKL